MKRIVISTFFAVILCFLAGCLSNITEFSTEDFQTSSSLMELLSKHYRLFDIKENKGYSTSAVLSMVAPTLDGCRMQYTAFTLNIAKYCKKYKNGTPSAKGDLKDSKYLNFECIKDNIPIFNGKIKLDKPLSKYDNYFLTVYIEEFNQPSIKQ